MTRDPLSLKASEKVTVGNVHLWCLHAREPVELPVPFQQRNRVAKSTHSISLEQLIPVFFLVSEAFLRLSNLFRNNSDRPHQANKIFHVWTPLAALVSG